MILSAWYVAWYRREWQPFNNERPWLLKITIPRLYAAEWASFLTPGIRAGADANTRCLYHKDELDLGILKPSVADIKVGLTQQIVGQFQPCAIGHILSYLSPDNSDYLGMSLDLRDQQGGENISNP